MDTQQLLARFLTDAHVHALGEGVTTGYAALKAVMDDSPVLSRFAPGRMLHGYLADPCVQYGLDAVAARTGLFHVTPAWNAAHNHVHMRFFVPGLCFTTHFIGQEAERDGARSAVNRAELHARCADLFADQESVVDPTSIEPAGPIYVHLLHGGLFRATAILLKIPDKTQVRYPLPPWPIPIPEPKHAEVEQVRERMHFELKNKAIGEEREVG